jgi:hypothetical protein
LLSAHVPFSHQANISSVRAPPEQAQHVGWHSDEWTHVDPGAESVVFGAAHPVAVIKSASLVRTMTLLSAAPGEHSVAL